MRVNSLVNLLAATLLAAAGILAQSPDAPFAEGEMLVKLRPGVRFSDIAAKTQPIAVRSAEPLGDLGWILLRFDKKISVNSAVTAFASEPEVEAAQPNFYYHLLAVPNDPQWGASGLYGLTKISAPVAWDFSTGSSSVVVANIDTGMRYTHEDLAANMWTNPGEINGNGIDDDGNGFADDYYGYDFFFNDPDPWDENGHGTHTGGTIGAVGNNLLGVVGVNWNIRIMAIKIYNSTGYGTTSAMLVNAYNYIRMMKLRGVNIRVTNNSYGGCDEACGYDQATRDALDALTAAGVLNVFAAGNDNRDNDVTPTFPASYESPGILAVASSTNTDSRSSFSNWGAISVDLAAPGSGILSTTRTSNSSYGTLSGTSMATPHVTGAAALLSAYDPTLTPASLKATLMNTVDVLPAWTNIVKSGGRLNVGAALQNRTVCNFNLSDNSVTVRFRGGYRTVAVNAPNNCDYEIRSEARWIILDGPGVRSGSGPITFRVTPSQRWSRTGTIRIAGQTVTVNQVRGAN